MKGRSSSFSACLLAKVDPLNAKGDDNYDTNSTDLGSLKLFDKSHCRADKFH